MNIKKIRKLVISLLLIIGFFSIQNVFAEETLFEGVGRYAIATAGNNNASHGTAPNIGYELIINYPPNWDTIKQNIPSNILSRINNMTGSELVYTGTPLKTYLNRTIYCESDCPTSYDILVIAPDGTYDVYTMPHSMTATNIEVLNKGSGWYYVSILDVPDKPQQSWVITTIYESNLIPMRYLKIIKEDTWIGKAHDSLYLDVYFNSSLKLKNNFQLYGVSLWGGESAWPMEDRYKDRAYAILSDGTYQQLYDKGDGHFGDRTQTDFANGIFNTIRSHNIKGGELDIFNETLSSDYFGGKEIVGYRFEIITDDCETCESYDIGLIGLAQEIEAPDLNITADIEKNPDDTLNNKVTLTNDSEYNSCSTKIEIPIDSNLTNIRNVVMTPSDVATYKLENNTITVTFKEQFKAHDTFTITYLADEIVVNKEQLDLDPVGTAYPGDGVLCPSEILSNKNLQISVTAHDDIKQVSVVVPDTGVFISIGTIIIGISIIGVGYFILLKNKKQMID